MGKWENIDAKKIKGVVSDPYVVVYYLYNVKDDKIKVPTDITKLKGAQKCGGACFSDLLYSLRDTSYNRIYYKPKNKLKDKAEKWIAFAVQHKLLPSYVKPEWVESGFVLEVDKQISPSLLYLYLTTIRQLDEDRNFSSAVMHLCDVGMDVHAAVVTASLYTIYGIGHFYLNTSAYNYGDVFNVGKRNIPLRNVIGLKRFLENPTIYDSRNCFSGGSFNAYSIISNSICKIERKVNVRQLFGPKHLEAIYAKNDVTSQSILSKLDADLAKKKKKAEKKAKKDV